MAMKVYIQHDQFTLGVGIWIYNQRPDGRREFWIPIADGQIEMRLVPDGTMCPPSLRIPDPEAGELFVALAEALDKQGIKTDSDAKIAGLLEATRYHLEDMRTLALAGKAKKPKT